MNVEPAVIFRELEPPPGGAARLRAKLRPASHSRAARFSWLGPIAVGVVAAVTVFAFRIVPDMAEPPEPGGLMTAAAFDRLLGRPSEPYELVVRRGSERLAVRELESRDPAVRVFRIDDISPGDDAAEDESP